MGDDGVVITGISNDGLREATAVTLVAGQLTTGGGADPAVISTKFATSHNLTLGQIFTLGGSSGQPVDLLVTGLHDSEQDLLIGQVVVTPETFALLGDPTMIQQLVVFTEPGADLSKVREGIEAATSDLPTVVVSDVDEFVQSRVDQFSQVFSILYALLALAIIISVLGIVNTLGLSVMERTREVGLLRAVGMTRPQLRRMVTLESVMVATLGAVLGVVLGVVFGSMLVTLLRDQGIQTLVIPWLQLVVFVVVAAIFGVLAAIGPARRAAHLNVLDSIAAE